MPTSSFSTLSMLCKKHAWTAAISKYAAPWSFLPVCLRLAGIRRSLLRRRCRAVSASPFGSALPFPQVMCTIILKLLQHKSYNQCQLLTLPIWIYHGGGTKWASGLPLFNFWVPASLCRSELTAASWLCPAFPLLTPSLWNLCPLPMSWSLCSVTSSCTFFLEV